VLDCPAVPVEKSLAVFPGADPCCVFGFAGHGWRSSVGPLARYNTLRSVTIYPGLPVSESLSDLRTLIVGGSGYNVAVSDPRDEFPNNFVGDLVHTERGWVVVPPTCCPDGHD
jgi:hypothetical protein